MEGYRLFPIALVIVLIALLIIPTASAAIHYGNKARAGMEGYNPLGMKLTGTYSMIKFAYDDTTNRFVLKYTIARNWAWKAWWCFTCFANIKSTTVSLTPTRLYDRAFWEQGSWNVHYNGYNEIELKTTSTPNYIYTDIWIYANGSPHQWPYLFDWIPVIIDFIIR